MKMNKKFLSLFLMIGFAGMMQPLHADDDDINDITIDCGDCSDCANFAEDCSAAFNCLGQCGAECFNFLGQCGTGCLECVGQCCVNDNRSQSNDNENNNSGVDIIVISDHDSFHGSDHGSFHGSDHGSYHGSDDGIFYVGSTHHKTHHEHCTVIKTMPQPAQQVQPVPSAPLLNPYHQVPGVSIMTPVQPLCTQAVPVGDAPRAAIAMVQLTKYPVDNDKNLK